MLKIQIVLLTMLTLLPLSAFASPSTLPVTLDASIEQPAYREGQPVMLALTLHNDAAKNLYTSSAFEESAFQIVVMDKAGLPVPRTAVGERVLTPPMAVSANSIAAFSPGQTLSYHFNLARLFDLSRIGVYTVTVSRRFRPWVLPRPAADTPVQEIVLSAGPLTVHMEDAAVRSGPIPYLAPLTHQPFLYVAGRYDDGISHYLVREDGTLSFSLAYSPLGSPRVAKGVASLAATPDGRFLYASNSTDHTVAQFRIGDNGVLFPLSPPTVPSNPFPGPLLIDPKGRFLYSLSGTVYAIGSDGRLTITASAENNPPVKNNAPNNTIVRGYFGVINPTGTCLYMGGGMSRLASNGEVTAPPSPTFGSFGPIGGNVNAIALSPDSNFAFVGVSTTLGSAFFDKIVPMRVAPDGTLSALPDATTPKAPPSEWPNQSRPDCLSLSIDPTGHFLVLLNPQYLACYRIGIEGTLALLNTVSQKGDLTTVFFGPVDHLVYVLNRNPSCLTAFRLDDEHGLLPSGLQMTNDLPFDASMASAIAPTPLKQGTVTGGLAVSASLPADVLPADAPVVLTVRLKNVTKHPIRLGTTGEDMSSFRLAVVGPQRQSPGVLRGVGEPLAASVPLLAAGHDLLDAPGPSTIPVILPPGGQHQYRFVLSRLADLTVAGNYTVQITRTLPGGAVVTSPVVPFLVDGPFNGRIRDGKYSVQIL